MDLSREEFLSRHAEIREDMRIYFAGVNSRLDVQNGRVGKLEQDRAAHNERLKTLETTDAESRRDARIDKRITLLISAVTVGVIEGLKAGWHALSTMAR